MRRRIMGLETEYGLYGVDRNGNQVPAIALAPTMFRGGAGGAGSSGAWLANGGRLYQDIGQHPEYATAESVHPDDVVAHALAGHRHVWRLAERAAERVRKGWRPAGEGGGLTVHDRRPMPPVTGNVEIHVVANNHDATATSSFGSHENYQMSSGIAVVDAANILAGFFASRNLWAGAGGIVLSEDDMSVSKFVISPRSQLVRTVVSGRATSDRPLVNVRNEPHSNRMWQRLHVTYPDTNWFSDIIWMRFATTHLALRALEAGVSPQAARMDNPVTAVRRWGGAPESAFQALPSELGSMTAVNMQEMWWEAAAKTTVEEPAEHWEHEALDRWRTTIDLLRTGDTSTCEWSLRRDVFERAGWEDSNRVRALDLMWGDLNSKFGVAQRLEKPRAGGDKVTMWSDTVASAMETPPADTRATGRGNFCSWALRNRVNVEVDWGRWAIRDGRIDASVDVSDPQDEGLMALRRLSAMCYHPKGHELREGP